MLVPRFHEDYLGEEVKLSRSDPLPDVTLIKLWIQWLATLSSGRIGATLTQSTMHTYWSRFRVAVHRKTWKEFPDQVRLEINDVSANYYQLPNSLKLTKITVHSRGSCRGSGSGTATSSHSTKEAEAGI